MKKREDLLSGLIRKLIPALVVVAVLVSCLMGTQAYTSGDDDPPGNVPISVMSQELLEGMAVGAQLHVQGDFRAVEGAGGEGVYQELLGVNTSAADSIAPASELERIGIVPVGQTSYTLPDGRVAEYSYGIARIEFLGEMKEGRVVFGPEGVQPSIGLSALQAIGFTVDSATQTLNRLPSAE